MTHLHTVTRTSVGSPIIAWLRGLAKPTWIALAFPAVELGLTLVALSIRDQALNLTLACAIAILPWGAALLIAGLEDDSRMPPMPERLLRIALLWGSFLTSGMLLSEVSLSRILMTPAMIGGVLVFISLVFAAIRHGPLTIFGAVAFLGGLATMIANGLTVAALPMTLESGFRLAGLVMLGGALSAFGGMIFAHTIRSPEIR